MDLLLNLYELEEKLLSLAQLVCFALVASEELDLVSVWEYFEHSF